MQYTLETILSTIGLTSEETKTYLLLLETGPTTVGVLAKRMALPRPSLYGFLKRLQVRGVVTQSLKNGVKTFAAESPAKIENIFNQEIELLQNKRQLYHELLPEIEKVIPSKFLTPKFQLYEGKEGVKHVLKDMLLYRDIETQAYWPIKAMVDILSPDFFRYLNKGRIKNNLYTRAIWPISQKVDIKKHPYLGVGSDFKREIRVAPRGIDFAMGYWIYKNKVAFISSRKESFGFIIESKELVDMLLSQFEIIWKLSKKIKVDSKDTKVFLKEINLYKLNS